MLNLVSKCSVLSMPTPISYTLQGAAEAVGLSTKTLSRAIESGDLLSFQPTAKDGKRGRTLILHADLMGWLTGEPRSA